MIGERPAQKQNQQQLRHGAKMRPESEKKTKGYSAASSVFSTASEASISAAFASTNLTM